MGKYSKKQRLRCQEFSTALIQTKNLIAIANKNVTKFSDFGDAAKNYNSGISSAQKHNEGYSYLRGEVPPPPLRKHPLFVANDSPKPLGAYA